MRIISGWAKGRRLSTPSGQGKDIRPTSDRAREALFSIIGSRVVGAKVLDLFAGTGALALEALSRGANHIVFVDCNRQSLNIIKRNIQVCKPADAAVTLQIVRYDLRKGIPPRILPSETDQLYDLIFLDPPYSQGLSLKTLEYLANGNLLAEGGLVIAEERSTEQLPEQLGVLVLTDQRIYGDTGFWFYSAHTHQVTLTEERT